MFQTEHKRRINGYIKVKIKRLKDLNPIASISLNLILNSCVSVNKPLNNCYDTQCKDYNEAIIQ